MSVGPEQVAWHAPTGCGRTQTAHQNCHYRINANQDRERSLDREEQARFRCSGRSFRCYGTVMPSRRHASCPLRWHNEEDRWHEGRNGARKAPCSPRAASGSGVLEEEPVCVAPKHEVPRPRSPRCPCSRRPCDEPCHSLPDPSLQTPGSAAYGVLAREGEDLGVAKAGTASSKRAGAPRHAGHSKACRSSRGEPSFILTTNGPVGSRPRVVSLGAV